MCGRNNDVAGLLVVCGREFPAAVMARIRARLRAGGEGLTRAALFAREPLCRVCAAAGKVAEAVIRDHIVPLAEGGQETEQNCQPLCQACSEELPSHLQVSAKVRQAAGAGFSDIPQDR